MRTESAAYYPGHGGWMSCLCERFGFVGISSKTEFMGHLSVAADWTSIYDSGNAAHPNSALAILLSVGHAKLARLARHSIHAIVH